MSGSRSRRSLGRKRGWKRFKFKQQAEHPCAYCGIPLSIATATVDHAIPLAKGGEDMEGNYRLACLKCNHEKGERLLPITAKPGTSDEKDPLNYSIETERWGGPQKP